MKYLVEDATKLEADVQEELHESSGIKIKNYYIHGTFSTPGTKNRNGRIYPSELWEKQVQEYQRHIKDVTVNAFGENEHPARTNVDKMKAVMRITELKMENGVVKGRAKILNNNSPETNQIKALIDEGMKIGVSSRGVGTVKNSIVEEFQLSTYDIVTDPSDYNANLSGITESLNESMQNKTFEVLEGSIQEIKVCSKESCSTFSKDEIQEATKQKFSELIENLVLTERSSANETLEKFEDEHKKEGKALRSIISKIRGFKEFNVGNGVLDFNVTGDIDETSLEILIKAFKKVTVFAEDSNTIRIKLYF